MDKKALARERKKLNEVIKRWNESRLDLFEISKPNENLEYNGVMRFYHQDGNNGKYATKCIRVSNQDSTKDVIDMLATKFRTDMRMLTLPKYCLYEVHEEEEMRKLDDDQYPLLVQLNWCKDDREGRFLLHNEDNKRPPQITEGFYDDKHDPMARPMTKQERKDKKKLDKKKKNTKKRGSNDDTNIPKISQPLTAGQELYNQVPESTFTRTVSNPEAVMKKRREQKLQKRGAETVKIYGDRIKPEHPYKSLLLLPNDKVPVVIQDTLNKYGLGKEKVEDYSIVQVVLPPNSDPEDSLSGGWGIETLLTDEDCPLAIVQAWQPHKGTLVFQLRHVSNINKDSQKQTKPPSVSSNHTIDKNISEPAEEPRPPDRKKHKSPPKKKEPPLQNAPVSRVSENRIQPSSGPTEADIMGGDIIKSSDPVPKILEFSNLFDDYTVHIVSPNITEIGTDRRTATYGPFIEVEHKQGVLPSHCVLANMEGVVTVTPHEGNNVEVFVDGRKIEETTMLNHSSIVWVGRRTHLVYCQPNGQIVVPYVVRQIKATNPNRTEPVNNHLPNRNNKQATRKAQTLPHNVEPPRSGDEYSNSSYSSHVRSTNDLSYKPQHDHIQQNGHDRNYNQNKKLNKPRQQQLPQPYKPFTLPCSLHINRSIGEESFVSEIVNISGGTLHFKLSPAYVIYLSLRDLITNTPKSSLNPAVEDYLNLVTDLLDQTIQMNSSMASELAFWMANSSELLNFIRQDRDLSPVTVQLQDVLAKTVQLAFRHLVQCMQRELFDFMPAFLSMSDEDIPGGEHPEQPRRSNPDEEPNMYDILHMLSSAMSLLRRCRVNAALTIQLFSQLFHFVNMWIFNEVVCKPELRLCCRLWGIKIRTRLARIEAWAEKQGLELAADCHLARVTQAMHLLQAPKHSEEDIAAISGTCFKLNSLQLRALLSNYEPSYEDGETDIANELIDKVVTVAQNTADELTRSDGREVCLEEDPDLQLPFLLPEDGYSCDVVRSMPSGLLEFLKNLAREKLCTYTVAKDAPGSWTVHFAIHSARESGGSDVSASTSQASSHAAQPEIATVVLHKKGGGMGLSIVAAKGTGQDRMGIYIRSVVEGGAAFHDGRLQAGDQLLSVDGHSLVGISQERAAELMTKTGQTVSLTVAKQGAVYHRLAKLLSQPTPPQQRVQQRRQHPTNYYQSRPKSEGYALSQGQNMPIEDNHPPRSNEAKSTQNISYSGNDNSGLNAYDHNHRGPNLNQSTPHLSSNDVFTHSTRSSRLNNHIRHSTAPAHAPYRSNSLSSSSKPTFRRTVSNEIVQGYTPRFREYKRRSADSDEEKREKVQTVQKDVPRSAISMGNLQASSYSKPVNDRNKTWQQKRAQNAYQQQRLKAASQSALSTANDFGKNNADAQWRRKEVQNLITQRSPRSPKDQYYETNKTPTDTRLLNQNQTPYAVANPNYEILPPPPSPPPENDHQSPYISPREDEFHPPPPSEVLHNASSAVGSNTFNHDNKFDKYQSSKTMDRASSGRKEETKRTNPVQKTIPQSAKSSTLPRHFKSVPAWEKESKEQAIQEQLNALRDEEIEELSAKFDSLTPFEKDRLNNLLKERDFQRRVEEESKRYYSDEGDDDEYIVPDRPDRDRLLQMQAASNADSPKIDQEERKRKQEEERYRKEQEEQDRRKKEERERVIRERLEQEQYEREQEEERKRQEEEDAIRIEKERLIREQEIWEEQKWEKEQEEMDRKAREAERQRRLHKEREEQRRQLEELRRERQEQEEAIRSLKAEREAQQRVMRLEREQQRRRERSMKHSYRDDEEDEERELLEKKLSEGKPSNFNRFSSSSAPRYAAPTSYRQPSTNSYVHSAERSHNPSAVKAPRPVSDGYMLRNNDVFASDDQSPPKSANIPSTPPASSSYRRPISYIASDKTPSVIGAQERYNDPRNKREETLRREQIQRRRAPDPSQMTFKDRQKLFTSGGSTPADKPRASKKLLELQNSLM